MLKNKYVKIILFLVIPVLIAGISFMYNFAGVMFSPGEVTLGHQEIKDSCFKCHAVLSHMSSACSSCHEKIGESLKTNTGFHGNLTKDHRENCIQCHTDHKGKNYFIVKDVRKAGELEDTSKQIWKANQHEESKRKPVSEDYYFKPELIEAKAKTFSWEAQKKDFSKNFDHTLTGYPLMGEHAKIDCEKCHKSLKEFTVNPKNGLMPDFFIKAVNREAMCYSCHKKNDDSKKGHQGKYGKDCSTCHVNGGNGKAWKLLVPKVQGFHENPKYELKGKHKKTECKKCHETAPFKKKEEDKTCYSCHKKNDDDKKGHQGKYGKKCGECHLDGGEKEEWKGLLPKIRGFHKEPKHELKGKHAKVQCQKCHDTAPFEKKDEQKSCYACHKKDDEKIHEDTLGRKCETCHNELKFTTSTFDHQKTKYPLVSSHKTVKCGKCHAEWSSEPGKKKIYRKILKTTCFACHAADDIHHGAFQTDCERCHRETYWGDLIGR